MKPMTDTELTQEEYEELVIFFSMLLMDYIRKQRVRRESSKEKEAALNSGMNKLLALLEPPYKPTGVEINRLRDLSGAGPWDCKDAIIRFRGDIDAANEYLRTRGWA